MTRAVLVAACLLILALVDNDVEGRLRKFICCQIRWAADAQNEL